MLKNNGATVSTSDTSQSLGFVQRGHALQAQPLHVQLDAADHGGEPSVCGLKAFLIDERRSFALADGSQAIIDCAKVAVLDIVDSPVHIHGETTETYHILSGTGRMLLGDVVQPVQAGSFILIPPGFRHGLVSDHAQVPVRVVMTFTPGLAPIEHQSLRDERILAPAASAVIAELQQSLAQTREGIT